MNKRKNFTNQDQKYFIEYIFFQIAKVQNYSVPFILNSINFVNMHNHWLHAGILNLPENWCVKKPSLQREAKGGYDNLF